MGNRIVAKIVQQQKDFKKKEKVNAETYIIINNN